MPSWAAFAGLTALVVVAFLSLARLSQAAIDDGPRSPVLRPLPHGDPGVGDDTDAVRAGQRHQPMSPGLLLLNVAFTQGLFGVVVVAGAFYFEIPSSALGVPAGAVATEPLSQGLALGLALWLANELGAAVADRLGVDHEETVRELLAPASPAGWVVLLLVALPLVAGVEELVFRAALIGAISAGLGTPAWALAGLSAVAFALGHGAQGTVGMVVTGLLGFALAGAFVLTGSLVVVVTAHYLVNALELAVHEGLDVSRPVSNG